MNNDLYDCLFYFSKDTFRFSNQIDVSMSVWPNVTFTMRLSEEKTHSFSFSRNVQSKSIEIWPERATRTNLTLKDEFRKCDAFQSYYPGSLSIFDESANLFPVNSPNRKMSQTWMRQLVHFFRIETIKEKTSSNYALAHSCNASIHVLPLGIYLLW